MDTEEEREYRAEVRARYAKEATDKKRADRLAEIDAEEKARANQGAATEEAIKLIKRGLKELFS